MDAWAARGRRWVMAGAVEEEGAGEVVARAVEARAAGAGRGRMVVVEAVPRLICFGGGMLRHAPAVAVPLRRVGTWERGRGPPLTGWMRCHPRSCCPGAHQRRRDRCRGAAGRTPCGHQVSPPPTHTHRARGRRWRETDGAEAGIRQRVAHRRLQLLSIGTHCSATSSTPPSLPGPCRHELLPTLRDS